MNDVLQIANYIQQQGELGRQRGMQNRLQELAPKALAGDYNATTQAYALDPQTAQAYEKGADRIGTQVYNVASAIKRYMGSGQEASAQKIYEQFAGSPAVQARFPGMSPMWNRNEVMPVVDSIMAQTMATQGGATNEMRTFDAMSANLSPEDRAKAQRVNLGLDPRAVTGAAKPGTFTGGDGKTRPTWNDPTTRETFVFDDTSQQWAPLAGGIGAAQQVTPAASTQGGIPTGPSVQMHSDMLASAADAMSKAGVDPAVIDAFIAAQTRGREDMPVGTPQASPTAAPPPRAANPALGVSRSPEEQAALTTAAQEQAKNAADLANYDAMTEKITRREAATANAQATAKNQAERADAQRTKSDALRVYEAGIRGLTSGLDATITGPVVGRLPAVTSGQQIAEGGVAAMAPILKQIFRTAGEGTFTDADQRLLLAMVPTRADTETARKAKLANIDTIVRAKLGPSPAAAAPAAPGRSAGAAGAGGVDDLLSKYGVR